MSEFDEIAETMMDLIVELPDGTLTDLPVFLAWLAVERPRAISVSERL